MIEFWRQVKKTAKCWEWTGTFHAVGYGRFWSIKFKDQYAHRAAWFLTNGPIPRSMHVLHHCDNPRCVRPSHLFLGTQVDNNKDAAKKGRTPHGSRHCMAKISEQDVMAIRKQLSMGVPQKRLAKKYGLVQASISFIKSRRNWARV